MNLNSTMGEEMVIACSPADAGIITVWSLSTGSELMHFHGCTTPRNALTPIATSFIAASQIHKPSPYPDSSAAPICFWTWGSPQIHHRIFPSEQTGPLACTSNGVYLVGGGISGQLYVWDPTTGQLIRSWKAHKRTVSSLILTDDESLLVSGGDDGFVYVWPLIRILDIAEGFDRDTQLPCLYSWAAHTLPVTGLACGIGGCNAILVSCSLDCTVKIWSLGLGTQLRNLRFHYGINCVVVDPSEHALYAGGTDGRIYVCLLKVYYRRGNGISDEDGIIGSLFNHTGPITALTFSRDGVTLVSASEDCTIRLWDTNTNCVLRMFNHRIGPVSGILVLPLLPQVSKPDYYGVQLASRDSYFETVSGSFSGCSYTKDMSRLFLSKIERAAIGVESQCHSIGLMEQQIKELGDMKANLAVVNEDRRRALDMLDKLVGVYYKFSELCKSEAIVGSEKKDAVEAQGDDNILFLHKSIDEGRRMLQ